MRRIFDHIDLRVTSIAKARPFYDKFLAAVGLGNARWGDDWGNVGAHDYEHPKPPFVHLEEVPDHRGNANRIAFWMDTEEEVNVAATTVRAAGGHAIEGPEYCHDYSPGYYAVFFEDMDGNKWEICCRSAPVRPKPAP
jgi:catechol 2,3-dioxygenase-like lactoylglutathione lyase family enzyme